MLRSFPPFYFTGETTQREIANVLLSEVRHTVGKAVPPHEHEAPYFSLLLWKARIGNAARALTSVTSRIRLYFIPLGRCTKTKCSGRAGFSP